MTTGLAATGASASLSASERVRVGFIGVGIRGGIVLDAFLKQPDTEVVAICDVYQPYLDKINDRLPRPVKTYTDFRKLIEHPDMDAVVIATPDHWHAIQTITACDAGKDVYGHF